MHRRIDRVNKYLLSITVIGLVTEETKKYRALCVGLLKKRNYK